MASRVDPAAATTVMVASGLQPLVSYPGNGKSPWPCVCMTCGREVAPTYASVKNGARCRYCSRCAVDPLQVVIEMRTKGWEPLEPYPGAGSPWRVRCATCQQDTTKRWNDVRSGKPGCGLCAKRRVSPVEALAVMRAAGLEPYCPYPGSNKAPWPSRCTTCGTDVAPVFNQVRSCGSACRRCGRDKVANLFRLPDGEAEARLRRRGFTALTPYVRRHDPWRVQHDACGWVWTPTFGTLDSGNGCPSCAVSGFKPSLPADLYLITHPAHAAHKVGIAGAHSDRVESWRQRGWLVYRLHRFPVGADAATAERRVLAWWRTTLQLPPVYELQGQDGWTETVAADAVSLPATWRELTKPFRPNSVD